MSDMKKDELAEDQSLMGDEAIEADAIQGELEALRVERDEMRDRFMRALADAGMTMMVVTHEISFAREVADRVIFMDGGQIVEQGTPSEVIDNPQHERTRRFLSLVEH